MAESVDALVSNTSGATRAGSTPALGTLKAKYLIIHLLSFFSFLSEMFPNCPQSSLCIPPKMGHLLHAIITFSIESGFSTIRNTFTKERV